MPTMRNYILTILMGVLLAADLMPSIRAESPESVRDAERGTQFFANAAAAEVATETALAAMANDFPSLNSDLTVYGTQAPSASTNQYYQNYTFLNPKTGATNSTYINWTGTNFLGTLSGIWSGVYGFKDLFSLYASAKSVNDPTGASAAQARLDVSLAEAPIFQWAIFYNGLLEFSDTTPLTINARVHANSNIYVGSPSSLIFNYPVTCTGTISAPANDGYGTNAWTGSVSYNATSGLKSVKNAPNLTIFPASSSVPNGLHAIIDLPQATDDENLKSQRYYNKAGLTMVLSNNVGIDFMFFTFKSSINDTAVYSASAPLTSVIGVNDDLTFAGNWNKVQTTDRNNTNYFGLRYWLDKKTFYDFRQGKTVSVTEINVGNLTNWINNWLTQTAPATNHPVAGKFGFVNPFNIIYFADVRTPPMGTLYALRLTNGMNLPAAGLTVATMNPLYISGNYNCPNAAYLGTTNTTACAPASVACDALTVLSPRWNDPGSSATLIGSRAATSGSKADTVNCALIAGIVSSTGITSTTFSGGIQNLPRLLEDWSSSTLTLNTSMVCLFNSAYATNQFKGPGSVYNVYNAPQLRQFSFDRNLLSPAGLPPGTPTLVMPVERTGQAILSATVVPP